MFIVWDVVDTGDGMLSWYYAVVFDICVALLTMTATPTPTLYHSVRW